MKKIESYKQLRNERLCSKIRLKELEGQIKNDFEEIKDGLKIRNLIGNTLKNHSPAEKSDIVKALISVGMSALVTKLLFRKRSFVTKALISLVAGKYANSLLSSNSANILGWIQSHIGKNRNNHQSNGRHYDESTVDVDWEL